LSGENISDLISAVKSLASAVADQKNGKNQLKEKRNSTKNVDPQQDSSDASKTTTTSPKKARKVGSRTVEAEAMINHAIDKIIEYNNQEDITHQDKFRVGIGALRTLTGRGDAVIKRVIDSREEEINEHHQTHQLDTYHNSKGNTAPPIDQVIHLDFSDLNL
jgi:hypothetical protein